MQDAVGAGIIAAGGSEPYWTTPETGKVFDRTAGVGSLVDAATSATGTTLGETIEECLAEDGEELLRSLQEPSALQPELVHGHVDNLLLDWRLGPEVDGTVDQKYDSLMKRFGELGTSAQAVSKVCAESHGLADLCLAPGSQKSLPTRAPV